MNEKGWSSCTDAGKMLTFLRGKASDRKLRLFMCASCRVVVARMGERMGHTLDLVERVAEGLAPLAELPADSETGDDTSWVVDAWRYARRCAKGAVQSGGGKPEARLQPHRLRCLFGNPWRPLPTRAFTAHITGLAQSMDATFPEVSPGYAILADALEELGKADAATLPDGTAREGLSRSRLGVGERVILWTSSNG
jgi:hypothetical protein